MTFGRMECRMHDSLIKLINDRATCRNFTDEEIPDDIVNMILSSACKSPSSRGFQTYSIIKIKDKEKLRTLVKLSRNQRFIETAPITFLFCIDYRSMMRIREIEPFPCIEADKFSNFWMSLIDTAIAAQTLCLTAESFGLKSVYIGNIINTLDQVSALFNIPKYVCPAFLVTIGFPKGSTKPSNKYSSSILVHDEIYKDPEIDVLMSAYKSKGGDRPLGNNDELMNRIYNTACQYHGVEYAEKCKEYMVKNGIISNFQFWLGNYYLDEDDFLDMKGYKEFMIKQGFNWLE